MAVHATLDAPSPAPLRWRDGKRYAWLLSLAVPLLVAAGPLVWLQTGEAWTLWLPALLLYGLV
ncbi:MAG: hypothetical protein JHC36_00670, partial [Tibeticola sp.]|nr:hypothetical protein [Tibeticola sp.]